MTGRAAILGVLTLALQTVAPAQRPAPFQAPTAFSEIDAGTAAGQYGNVDRLLIERGGATLVDRSYARDYQAISRGQKSAIGCGEGCADSTWMHEFNYLHPRWHPYYEGRGASTPSSR